MCSFVLPISAANKEVVEEDLEKFKRQAGCLGFTREPDYQYDQTKGDHLLSNSQAFNESVTQFLSL